MSSLRDQMPTCAAFVDELREAFGADMVNRVIRSGMKGEPVFYAEEGGATLGTKDESAGRAVSVADMDCWYRAEERRRAKP